MLKLLKWIIFGHIHRWEIVDNGTVANKQGDIVGRWYEYKCKRCGKMKYVQDI